MAKVSTYVPPRPAVAPAANPYPFEGIIGEAEGKGQAAIDSGVSTLQGDLSRFLQGRGVVAPEYQASAFESLNQAGNRASLMMRARLAEQRMRAELMKQRIKAMERAYKEEKRGMKYDMYAALLGSAGAIGAGAMGGKPGAQQPSSAMSNPMQQQGFGYGGGPGYGFGAGGY